VPKTEFRYGPVVVDQIDVRQTSCQTRADSLALSLRCIVLCCVVLYCIVSYCVVLYRIVLYRVVLYCIALHCIALYCVVLYRVVPCCIVLYCIVSYCVVSYRVVLYCIVFGCHSNGVWCLYYLTNGLLDLDAGRLARSQDPEGPAAGHPDTGFSWFSCVLDANAGMVPNYLPSCH
jgi:hypothetical protein